MHYGMVESEFVNKLFISVECDMSVTEDFQELFRQRKVEFFEEFGDDIDKIIQVNEQYHAENKKKEGESIKRRRTTR